MPPAGEMRRPALGVALSETDMADAAFLEVCARLLTLHMRMCYLNEFRCSSILAPAVAVQPPHSPEPDRFLPRVCAV